MMNNKNNNYQGQQEIYNSYEISKALYELRDDIMHKVILTYDDLVRITNFFNDFPIKDGENERINPRYELDLSKGPDGNMRPLFTYTPDRIQEMLSDPKVSGNYKATFDFMFSKWLKLFPNYVQAQVLAHRKREYIDFRKLSAYFWTWWMQGGETGILNGFKGSGKNAMALLMASYALSEDKNKKLATNTLIKEENFEYQSFTTIGEWFYIILKNASNGFTTLSIPDELTMAGIRRKQTMAKATLTLDAIDRGTRKADDDNLYIWHFESEVPNEFLSAAVFKGYKFGSKVQPRERSKGRFTIREGSKETVTHIKGIPDSPIKFLSEDFPTFVLDIDLGAIMAMWSKEEHKGGERKEMFAKLADIVLDQVEKARDIPLVDLTDDGWKLMDEAILISGISKKEIMGTNIFDKIIGEDQKLYVKPAQGYNWNMEIIENGTD